MVADQMMLAMRDYGREFPTPFATWSRRLALFSLQVVLVAIVLHRLASLPTPVALNLFAAGFAGATLALLLGLIAAVIIWRQGRGGAWSAAAGVLVSLLLFAWPAASLPFLLTLPKINDVTTDPQVPPRFVAAAKLRAHGANSIAYPGESFARLQAQAYPDIRPVVIPRPASEAFELVGDTVRRLKWQIVTETEPQGRGQPGYIEAIDRTLILGFYDDVIVRVDGDQRETRIDVRSASRYGQHDLGRNASRVRAFFKELQQRLDATVSGAGRGRRRARPDAAVPKRQKGGPALSAAPRKSQGRVQPSAQREQQRRERRRLRAEDRARDRQSQQFQQ